MAHQVSLAQVRGPARNPGFALIQLDQRDKLLNQCFDALRLIEHRAQFELEGQRTQAGQQVFQLVA